MVHILANHLRSEFLAVPQLVRFDMAHGQNGLEPTLLVKASSLSLKYLLRQKSFRLMVMRVGNKIAYAVEIPDDPEDPVATWSLMELPNEATALKTLITNPKCMVFLFNEVAVSVAWTEVDVRIDPSLVIAIDSVEFHTTPNDDDEILVGRRLDEVRTQTNVPETQLLSFNAIEWHEVQAAYITNQINSSNLSLFHKDEGGQQEEIAVWMTDNLHPQGCVKSPQVQEKNLRELSDILLSYEFGAFLIESKSLSVLTRDNLPDRNKLANDLSKHIAKATRQLIGGIRNLKNGAIVKDQAGRVLNIEREKPVQTIILIPDLALLQDATQFGADFIKQFMEATGGYLHILDPAELLRIVQAAEMIVEDSEHLTKMMAFDWYLLERVKRAMKQATPNFAILFRRGASDKTKEI
jgi:hypothetical protein